MSEVDRLMMLALHGDTETLREELTALVDDAHGTDSTPCAEEMWSWDYYRSQQVDGYWMACHRVGSHDEHENSETGATWATGANEATDD